jgi:hypothetical protein
MMAALRRPEPEFCRAQGDSSILNLQEKTRIGRGAMTKRKVERFSATKAVKANARERVGQPKPSRVVEDKPRTGRSVKHKEKLENLVEGKE